MISTAVVTTSHGSKYLRQLCRHWAHKMTVDYDDVIARIDFGEGKTAALFASADELHISVADADEAGIGILQQVLEDHIRRFGFREDLTFGWTRMPVGDTAIVGP